VSTKPVKVGIVGLGRWAKVLTRAAAKSDKLQIVAGYSRSEEKRTAFAQELGIPVVPTIEAMLSNPEIQGVILTVPNEQHLPVATAVAKAGKHVYTEKPIASTLPEGMQIDALQKEYGITVTVGHSARLMAGMRKIHAAITSGELGRVGAGIKIERPAAHYRSSRSICSMSCTTWEAIFWRLPRWRQNFRRSAPKWMTSP
jgi:predicted dehydrogenase